jgi:class 3 adenylate cyclase
MSRRSGRVLVAVMFTDIVGSSDVVAELGDQRWRALLAAHHRRVRRALSQFGGREVDTAGDGVFAVFDDQGEAIRCACAIVDGVRDYGLEVRAGLTAGQVERSGRTHGGIAVHTGARIMAEAGAGQVFVSGVLRDLVRGERFAFADLGTRDLKGIPDEVHLYEVAEVDGVARGTPLAPVEAARRRASIEAPRLGRRSRRRTVAIVVAGVLALVVGGVWIASHRASAATVRVAPDSLLRIDPTTGHFLADVPVVDPGATRPLAVPKHQIWTYSYSNQTVNRIDASDTTTRLAGVNTQLGIAVVPQAFTAGMTYSDSWVWVATAADVVSKLNPATGDKLATFTPKPVQLPGADGPRQTPVAAANVDGKPWIFCHNGAVYQYDDQTLRFVKIQMPPVIQPASIAVGDGYVWVTTYAASLIRIDPSSYRQRTYPINPPASGSTGVIFAHGFVWVADLGSETTPAMVSRISPDTGQVRNVTLGGLYKGSITNDVAAAGGAIWATDPNTQTIDRIDPINMRVTKRIPIRYIPRDMVSAYGSLWVTISQS